MKKDLISLVGGILLIGVSRIDREWRSFWLGAGVLFIVWSLATLVSSLRKK